MAAIIQPRVAAFAAPRYAGRVSTTVACRQCGALNGSEFGRCIRCNADLDGAAPAVGAARRVPAPRLPGRGLAVGAGESIFGMPAESLPVAKALLAVNL